MRWLDHRLNGHEFDQALGDGEGQGSLACCSPWGCKESDRTERLNNNNNKKEALNILRVAVCSIPSKYFSKPTYMFVRDNYPDSLCFVLFSF